MAAARMNRGMAGGVAVLAFALAVLTGYTIFSGDDEKRVPGPHNAGPSASPSPKPTYTRPEDWTEPDRWVALPRGKSKDSKGNEIRFEHTTGGAMAMLSIAHSVSVERGRTTVDVQMDVYDAYIISDQQTDTNEEALEKKFAAADKKLRRKLGVPVDKDLPEGAHMHNTVIGYQVVKETEDEVWAWVLTRGTLKSGPSDPEEVSYTRQLTAAEWEPGLKGGDWKLSPQALVRAAQQEGSERPEIAAPGDPAFNEAGWTAIRSAS